ncbi:MAG: alpha-1,2-fucosyltransferase [Colwellia sp.]
MVKVKIIGGLGNQMFQYATAKALAVKHNTEVSANISAFSSYEVHPLSIDKLSCKCKFDSRGDFLSKMLDFSYFRKTFSKFSHFFNVHIEKDLSYNAELFNSDIGVSLFGYFQSEKYFLNIRELLLEEFSLSAPLAKHEATIENRITESDSVAIHIRRGDYISNKSANSVHGTCENDYFINALSNLKKSNLLSDATVLFIFSDDIEWCQDNLSFEYQTVFVKGSSDRPEVDIHLMSKCKHQIISNSTFSWWGAWLNTNPNKCVIAPLQWFKTLHDSTDIVPEQWKRL